MRTVYTSETLTNDLVDKVDGSDAYVRKKKIVFGSDGTATDVTADTPFPTVDSSGGEKLDVLHADNLVLESKLDDLNFDLNSGFNELHTDLVAIEGKQDAQTALLTQIKTNTDGLSRANAPARIDYTTVNGGAGVSTSAYTQLVASLSGAVKALYIFDSSGRALYLATGAAASEVDQIYIEPGGTGLVHLAIPAGTRLSVKAVDAAATQGQLLVSFLG